MTDLISIIGTVASIGSIPLALYLYFRSAEAKKDRVRRDVVRIIAFQIGDGRMPTTFEIQSVINSKSRESKIKSQDIDMNDVIEDLIAEIISTPILATEIKDKYISSFNLLYTRGQMLGLVDKITAETDSTQLSVNIEADIKQLLQAKEGLQNDSKKIQIRYSEIFAVASASLSILGAIIVTASQSFSFDVVSNFISNHKDVANITLSVLASSIGVITAVAIQFYLSKARKK